jgi:hypothetical protein
VRKRRPTTRLPEPPGEIRTREIIGAITDELRPYRNRLDGQQRQADEVSKWLAKRIELLRDVVPQHFTSKARRQIRADARGIIETIKLLQGQIRNAVQELHLRWGSLDLITISDPLDKGEDEAIPTTLFFPVSPRVSELLAELNWLSDICAEAVDAKADTTDQCKRLCVDMAWSSIGLFSQNTATIERLGTIAGWLYEAVTGIKKKDFRYLCQQMLKRLKT